MLKLTLTVFALILALIGVVNLTEVTYYEILGISKKASAPEIRQAYKKLAVKFHPDKNPNEQKQEKFLKITEAYETLKDPDKRRKYDLYGSYQSYSKKYDYRSQAEYDNLFYNGLYHKDPFVDTLSGANFHNYLTEGFHFINFYSPFCPPCQNIADEWKKLAEIYKGIIKVAAVNCKYHNSFCYNSMRIGSYPSLIFYPNGKNGNFIYYRGDRTLEGLDQFVMSYIGTQVHVPTVYKLRSSDKPMAYVLGANRIDKSVLTRIAYHLNGLVSVVVVEDDVLRDKMTSNDYTTVVFKYRSTNIEIESADEKEILREIVEALPKIELIEPDKLKDIRNQLRNGGKTPWVLYFSTRGDDRLQLNQMRVSFPNMHFGEIECDRWSELCASLHVESAPAWGVLKQGGAYQRARPLVAVRDFIHAASHARSLHTLSASDFTRILDGDVGIWVLLIVPYQVSWDDIDEPFTRTSVHFNDNEEINFGIMACTLNTDKYCREVDQNQATVLVQNGTKRHTYSGQVDERQLLEFIQMLRDTADLELNEKQVLEMLHGGGRHAWAVAYLPLNCARACDQLAHQWRILAHKLRPLKFVRVGLLRCASAAGFCGNVRSPTARLYPIASEQHYSVSLQHLAQAPYMLEWALQYIDDSVQKLNWQTFTRTVIAEELNPTGGKKPWLIYFHSPRCYRCYEMYADFVIAGILLNNAVHLGKINCVTERSMCQHEQITSYPSLKLYLNRNQHQAFSSVIPIQVTDYEGLLREIRSHLMKYDENILAGVDSLVGKGFRHDEF